MKFTILALLILLLLPTCSVIDKAQQQKRMPLPDFASIGPVSTTTSSEDPPVEKTWKNIRELRGLPSSQLLPVMALMSNSLGVTCTHCHSEHFEEEGKIEKEMARGMIRMTRAINAAQFQGNPTVTCYTCHRGQEYPSSVPEIAQAGWQKMLLPVAPDETMPALASVIGRHEAAAPSIPPLAGSGAITLLGGLDARLSGRFAIQQAASGDLKVATSLPLPEGFERTLSSYLATPLNLGERYQELTVVRRAKVDAQDGWIVMAVPEDGRAEQLTFDAVTGNLLRIQRGTGTTLGWVPEALSFFDYRSNGEASVPGTIRWSRGDFQVTLRFD